MMLDETTHQTIFENRDGNEILAEMNADERVEWALQHLPGQHVISSSFGIQAAVSLHLLTRHQPDIPVVFIDTGYLFPETYRFVDDLTNRLSLNLRVYRPGLSSAWLEARFGNLWKQGTEGLNRYNHISKLEPMQQALEELGVSTWFSGLRRQQSTSRADTPFLRLKQGRYRVYPIADWSSHDVWQYLKANDLPYHPLWEQGYVSVGDVQTTRRLEPGMKEEDTRFFGLQRECGLHTEL